jgi:hypothetical protein
LLYEVCRVTFARVLATNSFDLRRIGTLHQCSSVGPGATHWWFANLYPVTIEKQVIGIGIVVLDVTD